MSHRPQLDHVVLAVNDLAAAADDFRALGFTVTPGGEHRGRSSHNALIVFDDGAYLELKAWRAPAPDEAWWRTLDAHGDGLVDCALWPASVPAALADAHARGLHTLRGPVPGRRARPDGADVRWETARHDTPDVPFLCADLTPRALRVPEGAARQHANAATGVACVQMATHDLAQTARRHQALLGTGLSWQWAGRDGDMAGLRYRLGGADFELFGPLALADQADIAIQLIAIDASPHSAFDAARARLIGHGEGPFACRLRAAEGTPARVLDPARTHGARLVLGQARACSRYF
ncbi:VOC family protein [Ottowia sp.]|uniref:VOC family protein n=1 Tax=Ottowia sp. TaxID=1898956 RepID=UPI002C50E618|nr:VOC family protein [Ottowia sp.]HOB66452.1 VOC family protein [Ottowia sp.]HPZ57365.1 VOC family protein [Ottowia sp.]HQD48926.1 VOC family protein [Ottowia sp.]